HNDHRHCHDQSSVSDRLDGVACSPPYSDKRLADAGSTEISHLSCCSEEVLHQGDDEPISQWILEVMVGSTRRERITGIAFSHRIASCLKRVGASITVECQPRDCGEANESSNSGFPACVHVSPPALRRAVGDMTRTASSSPNDKTRLRPTSWWPSV